MENTTSPQTSPVPHLLCPKCKNPLKGTEYFCPQCGHKVKEPPPQTSIGKQISLYVFSIAFPPFGIIPAIKYVRSPDSKTQIVGVVAIFLSLATFIILVWLGMTLFNQLNDSISSQLNQLGQYQNLGI